MSVDEKLDDLAAVCAEMQADVRELRVRQANLEALLREYARRLNAHAQDDKIIEARVSSLDIWRAHAQGARWGIVAAFTFFGSAAGAAIGWLLK